MQHNFSVSEDEAGQRLDVLVAARLSVSRGRAQKLLETATLNGKAAKASHAVRHGDRILLDEPEAAEPVPPYATVSRELPPIIYEDEHLLVLHKPRGLTVHAGAGEPQETLVDVLRANGRALSGVGPAERAGIVHRIDKETSGLLVVCKTDEAHWKLAADFAERRVRKEYLALVCGVPRGAGRVEAPIARHPGNRKKMAVASTGRPAVTEFTVERAWQQYAQLRINLLTGRTHQIRVHLSYVHHPVVADEVYGGLQRSLNSAPNDDARAAIEALSGQALHAARLAFAHPISGELLNFTSPLPEDMRRVGDVLNQAR